MGTVHEIRITSGHPCQTGAMKPAAPLKNTWGFARRRSRVGLLRVRSSLPKIIQITVCAVGAYWIAEALLGHQGPLFAATSAMVALGFGRDTHTRRTLEVALGCTLGIAVGDLLLTLLGTGLWQAVVVVFVSLVIARFLDGGTIFSTQLGLQALLVVLLPAPPEGPFARSIDAVVGGVLAILITMLTPRDPRREPMHELGNLLEELSAVLREGSTALLQSDPTRAWHALIRARATQKTMDAMPAALRAAREIATLAPAHRRHRTEVQRLGRVAEKTDLAVRNSRVFARRLASVINHAALDDDAIDQVGQLLAELADSVDTLRRSVGEPQASAQRRAEHVARTELAACASRLSPELLGVAGVQGEGLVLLLRPMLVDLMEAAGLDHDDAVAYLPRL